MHINMYLVCGETNIHVNIVNAVHGNLLVGLNMEIQPGWRVGVVGHSGSGKSSLVKLLYRLYDPQSGRITFDGQDVRDLELQSFR